MGNLKYSITFNSDDRTKAPVEIDCKKASDENISITRYEKDGEIWERMSTRPGRGKQAREAMTKRVEKKFDWLIEQNKTLEGCKIIHEKMFYEKYVIMIPISDSLFDKLSAKEKQLAKKEKASVKKKLAEKKKQVNKSENKTTKRKREAR